MAFDGNGNWISDFSAVADRDANIKILASRFDNIFIADIAQSFENCLTKDMQVKPQQAFDANSYKVINVANPANDNDAVNLQTVNGKDALCVHLAGSETITGNKTFSGTNTFSNTNTFSGTNTISGTLNVTGSVNGSSKVMGVPNWSGSYDISSGFVAPSNGTVVGSGRSPTIGGTAAIYVNGILVASGGHTSTWVEPCFCQCPLAKGDTVTVSGYSGTLKFVPCK